MMLSFQQYALAENIGLSLWFERRSLFNVKPPRVFAILGIVVSRELNSEEALKVFKGMLSVLSLQESAYWLGWFDPQTEITVERLRVVLQKWRPHAILGMGQPFRDWVNERSLVEMTHFTATYHPQELIENPSLKKKAYQDLLQLKETLVLIKPE